MSGRGHRRLGAEVGMAQPVRIVDGVVPKHEQLRSILTELATRELAPGDMLPSERQLCLDHGVSRITVREAIGQLVSEGLLVRVRGKGTFVAERTVRSRLHLASFQEDMRRLGLEPTTVLLSAEHAEPPSRTAELFAPRGGAMGYHIRRLRVATVSRSRWTTPGTTRRWRQGWTGST